MRLHLAHVVVIGGGYVGQLIQLAFPSVRLLDWRRTPPANHLETRVGPQYLWEPIPGVTSTSFPVTTLVDGHPPTSPAIHAYKRKIGKEHDGGDWGLQFQHQTIGWHSNLPVPRVEYNRRVRCVDLSGHRLLLEDEQVIDYDVLINTIPLDAFLRLCLIQPIVHELWRQDPIYMIQEPKIVDAAVPSQMTLNYLSTPDDPCYRVTTVSVGHLQLLFHESLSAVPGSRKMPMGKIHPHPESEDVLSALKIFDTFCFGRFATWRPDELAHETWKHIHAWKGTL